MVDPVRQGAANDEQMKKIVVVNDDITEIFTAHGLDFSMKITCTVSMLSMMISCIHPDARESAIKTVLKTLYDNLVWLDKVERSSD